MARLQKEKRNTSGSGLKMRRLLRTTPRKDSPTGQEIPKAGTGTNNHPPPVAGNFLTPTFSTPLLPPVVWCLARLFLCCYVHFLSIWPGSSDLQGSEVFCFLSVGVRLWGVDKLHCPLTFASFSSGGSLSFRVFVKFSFRSVRDRAQCESAKLGAGSWYGSSCLSILQGTRDGKRV